MSSLDYDISEDDIVAFGMAGLRASRPFRRLLWILVGLGCAVIALLWLLLLLVGRESWPAWFLLVVGIPSMLLLVRPIIWLRMPGVLRRNLRSGRNRTLIGKQRMELLPDGVRRVHSEGESKVAWTGIERLLRSRDHLALFIAANQAFVVPRRAFVRPADEADFVATAERLFGHRFEEAPTS